MIIYRFFKKRHKPIRKKESCSAGATNKADVWREVQTREKNIDFLKISKIIYQHSSFRGRIND